MRGIEVMLPELGGVAEPPWRSTRKMHSFDGECPDAIRQRLGSDFDIEVFDFLAGLRVERRAVGPCMKALKQINLPMWMTRATTLKSNAGAVPVSQSRPFKSE